MTVELAGRALDVDLLARELGNWRTSSRSWPGLPGPGRRHPDADHRRPPPGRRPAAQRARARRALRVSRTTVTAAYAQLRDDGYLNARRGARSTTALPVAPSPAPDAAPASVNLAAAALSAPAAVVLEAFTEATHHVDAVSARHRRRAHRGRSLRPAIAERYCARGLPTEPDEIMVTTGALHAIGLILATYVQPGDRVLVEQPTYHGALSAITTAGARPVPVAIDRGRLGTGRACTPRCANWRPAWPTWCPTTTTRPG